MENFEQGIDRPEQIVPVSIRVTVPDVIVFYFYINNRLICFQTYFGFMSINNVYSFNSKYNLR